MSAREVRTNQLGIHQHLRTVVQKHLDHPWQKPISDFSLEVYSNIEAWIAKDSSPLILDSGCGTGESSANLARQFPHARVIGFDRSEVRLDKLKKLTDVPDNCLVVRADADDLWRQLVNAGATIQKHYLTFPNPYPKAAQLNQRWHGSPVFPYLIQLSGNIELRSNWRVYIDEFAEALQIASAAQITIEAYQPKTPLSAFERKYYESDQILWRLQANLF